MVEFLPSAETEDGITITGEQLVDRKLILPNCPLASLSRPRLNALTAAVFCWLSVLISHGSAQNLDPDRPGLEGGVEDPLANITREQWQERIGQAKQQARDAAAKARSEPSRDTGPSPEEADRRATERVLNDSTLERGDIVVTDKGTFVFRGAANDERKPSDFVPWSPR